MSAFELAATRRPDAVFAGVYDPRVRGDRDRDRQALTGSLARFGAVAIYESGPLLVAVATPTSRPAPRHEAPDGSVCFLDGYVDNISQLASAAPSDTTEST